eukprot:COSAG06_NODE_327_length_17446_cov_7.157491_8_plen_90_part_00
MISTAVLSDLYGHSPLVSGLSLWRTAHTWPHQPLAKAGAIRVHKQAAIPQQYSLGPRRADGRHGKRRRRRRRDDGGGEGHAIGQRGLQM